MARALRIEFENAVYHVTARGDRREPIFDDDADRLALLGIAALGFERFDATALAYCLMGNHYHFVLQTRRANLSMLMRHINANYSQSFNRRHGLVGHVFQGRFKAIVVDTDAYLLEVCRYVDLNPIRANMVAAPGDWRWSSYLAHTGAVERPHWLSSTPLYEQLAPLTPLEDGPARYPVFVAQGQGVRLWDEALKGQIYLGDDDFAVRTQARVLGSTGAVQNVEVPKRPNAARCACRWHPIWPTTYPQQNATWASCRRSEQVATRRPRLRGIAVCRFHGSAGLLRRGRWGRKARRDAFHPQFALNLQNWLKWPIFMA